MSSLRANRSTVCTCRQLLDLFTKWRETGSNSLRCQTSCCCGCCRWWPYYIHTFCNLFNEKLSKQLFCAELIMKWLLISFFFLMFHLNRKRCWHCRHSTCKSICSSMCSHLQRWFSSYNRGQHQRHSDWCSFNLRRCGDEFITKVAHNFLLCFVYYIILCTIPSSYLPPPTSWTMLLSLSLSLGTRILLSWIVNQLNLCNKIQQWALTIINIFALQLYQ